MDRATRRKFLVRGSVVWTGLVAGCNSGADGSATTEDETTESGPGGTDTPTPANSTTQAETPTGTETESQRPPVSLKTTWPTFQHDSHHTGAPPDASGPKQGVARAWKPPLTVDPENLKKQEITPVGQPAMTKDGIYLRSKNGEFLAIDPKTGRQQWEYTEGKAPETAPTVAGGTVYFGTDRGIVALNAADGTKQWEFTDDPVTTPVVVASETVYAGSTGGYLYAFDAPSGKRKWRYEVGPEVESPPSTARGVVLVTGASLSTTKGARGAFHAINQPTGSVAWKRDKIATAATPAVRDGTAYVNGSKQVRDGNVYLWAINVVDGTTKWKTEISGWRETYHAAPAVDGKRVYTIVDDTKLAAFSRSDGSRRWTRSVGTDPGAVVVADGVVYLSRGRTIFAFDGKSGSFAWSTERPAPVGAPMPVNGHLFTGSELLANAKPNGDGGADLTGAWKAWQADPRNTGYRNGTSGPRTGVAEQWTIEQGRGGTAPVVADGVVYAPGPERYLRALNATSGSTLWKSDVRNPTAAPQIADGTIYVPSDRGLFALAPGNGVPKWVYESEDDYRAAAVGGGTAIGVAKESLDALDAKSGNQRWRTDIEAEDIYAEFNRRPPAIANGTIYGTANEGAGLRTFDLKSGNRGWNFAAGEYATAKFRTPTVAGGRVYLVGKYKETSGLFVLNAADGSRIWTKELGKTMTVSPAVKDGVVYVGTKDGKLYAFDTSAKKRKWKYNVGSAITGEPVTDGKTVYVGAADNNVYAFDAENGAWQWSFETNSTVGNPVALVQNHLFVSNGKKLYALGSK